MGYGGLEEKMCDRRATFRRTERGGNLDVGMGATCVGHDTGAEAR